MSSQERGLLPLDGSPSDSGRSDDLLLIPIQSPSFFQSYVGAVVLAEMLAGMIVARGGQSVVDNIDNLERCRREMGEYWQE